jgi:site-specific recombinase XerD
MVSKMLGHKSIKTTQIYARVQQPMIQEQAERLSKLAL